MFGYYRRLMDFLKKLDFFTWLASITTSRAPILKGLLPTIGTLFTLLLISLAIAGGIALWSNMVMKASVLLPLYVKTIAWVLVGGIVNLFFQRDIVTAELSSREILKGVEHNEPKDSIDMRKLVEGLVCELNAHCQNKPGHVDLITPQLAYGSVKGRNIYTVLGFTPDNAAMFFNQKFFNAKNTGWNQHHLEAVVMLQLIRIYHRRGWSAMLVASIAEIFSTIEFFRQSDNDLYRWIGYVMGPLRYLTFVQRAVERSYDYEAIAVLKEMGLEMYYYEAIDIQVAPSVYQPLSPSYISFQKDRAKPAPYKGWFEAWWGPIANKIDNMIWQHNEADKRDYRIISGSRAFVREALFSYKELLATDQSGKGKNRITRLKDEVRNLIGLGSLGRELIAATGENASPSVQDFMQRMRGKAPGKEILDDQALEKIKESLRVIMKEYTHEESESCLHKPLATLEKEDPLIFDKMLTVLADQEMQTLHRRAREQNRKLYNAIPAEKRYEPLDPDGSGKRDLRIKIA